MRLNKSHRKKKKKVMASNRALFKPQNSDYEAHDIVFTTITFHLFSFKDSVLAQMIMNLLTVAQSHRKPRPPTVPFSIHRKSF